MEEMHSQVWGGAWSSRALSEPVALPAPVFINPEAL